LRLQIPIGGLVLQLSDPKSKDLIKEVGQSGSELLAGHRRSIGGRACLLVLGDFLLGREVDMITRQVAEGPDESGHPLDGVSVGCAWVLVERLLVSEQLLRDL